MSSVTEWRKSLEIFLRQNQDNSSKQNISIQVRNTLDQKFLDFIDSIKNQPRDKILHRIKKNYQKVDSNFEKILEDYFKMFTFWGTLDEAKKDFNLYEPKALLGCKKQIQRYHSKLAISVYHYNEDIWKIPRMIDDICPGYQFYLRYHGGDLYPTEVTLLAKFQNR